MPVLVSQTIKKTPIAVTRCKLDTPNHGLTSPLPREDAYMVVVQIGERSERDLWLDGKPFKADILGPGDVVMHDLRRRPSFNLRSPLNSLHFYLPRPTLDAIADEANAPSIVDLAFTPGVSIRDPILAALGGLLLPAFGHAEGVSKLLVDHLTQAAGIHIAQVYGGMKCAAGVVRGGLAAWQERRAKELLAANLAGDVSLTDLARECRLSTSHFARAFRKSTGLAPHQWLLQRRVELAKALLNEGKLSLGDIAISCGFSDQSHFTRVYTRLCGVSPGAWRRFNNRPPKTTDMSAISEA